MTPLFDAVYAYSTGAAAAFHMPGHKLGRGFALRPEFLGAARLDVTELPQTDDLHDARGPLLAAQELAAQAFGAGRTWFLVNGSSCGIHAMIAAFCAAGDKLLIARDFHYSAYNAMCFARVRPVYIPVRGHTAAGADGVGGSVFRVPDTGDVAAALRAHPDAAALYLTRPGYYGSVCDIESIAALAHERGIPVLVDEAHGAHLAFSPRLPVCALKGGADFCVQSAHKTLPAFTQCAYAHMSRHAMARDTAALAERVSAALRAFETSSPSFLFTASLDYARDYMEERGAAELDRVVDRCAEFYRNMERIGYGVPGDAVPADSNRRGRWQSSRCSTRKCGEKITDGTAAEGVRYKRDMTRLVRYKRDMTRLVLDTTRFGLSGGEVERLLAERRVAIEMSDASHIVMIATVADSDEDFALLESALSDIASPSPNTQCSGATPSPDAAAFDAAADVGTPRDIAELSPAPLPAFIDALHAPRARIPLELAVGMTAAEPVTPYPPGIPVLCPGERITARTLQIIRSLLASGARVKGIYATTPDAYARGSCAGGRDGYTIDVYDLNTKRGNGIFC